ncbi:UDP-D-galactose:(glucosyl)lipopolysaccharide-1, 6-D-galactosyltransferase [bacterium BMS3Abin15]|nr:UDP-D-galactose:(glucosyl)lipopolysaccharide-1, 6-D-galactosyltransferase [bacterium BMS3Abin15]
MNKYKNKKLHILSSRTGGPLNQHLLLTEELRKVGIVVKHYNDFWGWVKLHFIYGKNNYILTNVPILFRFTARNFFLSIHGNYKKERDIVKNPLAFLYGINKIWSQEIIVPANYLKTVLDIKNAIVIKNVLSEKIIRKGLEKKKYNTDHINLIMVTMFGFREKAQGVLRVIEILSGIKTRKEVTLNICGSGFFEEEVRERSEKYKLPSNIKFIFNGYEKNIHEKYKESDIFIYWSDLDVMPNVFLEAMAFGLPIITNNFPSFHEFLGEGSLIVKNKYEFIKALEELINSSDKIKELGNKNRETAKKYSPKNTVNDWMRLLE